MDWLRDPIWQFIGALIGIVAIVTSYYFFKRQQKHRSIAYEIISNTNLLNISNEIKSKLEVLFEQKPVEKLSLLILKIYNAGNEPILAVDFEKEIIIEFSAVSEILEAGIDKVAPENLQPQIIHTKREVTLQPLLLNGGDSITLKILLSSFDSNIDVKGRIAGIKYISGTNKAKPTTYRIDLFFIYFYSVAGTLLATIFGTLLFEEFSFINLFFMSFGILIALSPILGIIVVENGIKKLMQD